MEGNMPATQLSLFFWQSTGFLSRGFLYTTKNEKQIHSTNKQAAAF